MASNPKKSLNFNSPFIAPENDLWATFTIARFLFPRLVVSATTTTACVFSVSHWLLVNRSLSIISSDSSIVNWRHGPRVSGINQIFQM